VAKVVSPAMAERGLAGAFQQRAGRLLQVFGWCRRQNESLPPNCQNLGSCEPVAAPKLPSGVL
jgi:hypothetical protein